MKDAVCIFAAGLFLASCTGNDGSNVDDAPAPQKQKWLVRGEVEPFDQFVFAQDSLVAHGEGTLVGPGTGLQDYRIFVIDAREIDGGNLRVTLHMDEAGESAASMDLFDAEAFISADPKGQEELRTSPHQLAFQYGTQGIKPGEQGVLEYAFSDGQIFQLGVTGDWFSPAGASTDFELEIRIEPAQ